MSPRRQQQRVPAPFRADRSGESYRVAVKRFNDYQRNVTNDPPFEELTAADVENDNLQQILYRYGTYLPSAKLAHYNTSGKNLAASSKSQYHSNLVTAFRDKFWRHELWRDPTYESWHKEVLAGIERRSVREARSDADEANDARTRPLYMKADPSLLRYADRTSPAWNQRKGVDLESICSQLIGAATEANKNCIMWSMIMDIYFGVGRGGEPKFLRLDDMEWDPLFEIVTMKWVQSKVLTSHRLTFGHSYNSFLCDWFLSKAFYFAFNNGLVRNANQAAARKFLYPHLHSKKDATVTKDVTSALRACCSDDLKQFTTAKR